MQDEIISFCHPLSLLNPIIFYVKLFFFVAKSLARAYFEGSRVIFAKLLVEFLEVIQNWFFCWLKNISGEFKIETFLKRFSGVRKNTEKSILGIIFINRQEN